MNEGIIALVFLAIGLFIGLIGSKYYDIGSKKRK